MSTAARPAIAIQPAPASAWTPWLLAAADVLALELSFALGLATRRLLSGFLTAGIGIEQYLGVAAGILLLPLINYQLGLYPGYLLGPVERLRRRFLATCAVFGGLVAWDSLVERGVLSRGVLLATLLFALVLPPLAETAARWLLIRGKRWGTPAIIIGNGSAARAIERTLQREPQLGLRAVATLGPGLATAYERYAEVAIVCLADLGKHNTASLLHDLNFARVIVVPDLAGVANLWVTARQLGGALGFEIKRNLLLRRNHALKAAMDRAIAFPLFLLSLPVMASAALWIRLASRGPAFYRQMREGHAGRRIAVWKLRTMRTDGDRILEQWFEEHPEDEAHWKRFYKLPRDPRVLPVIGPLLRRTSLDELPQLWSVLRGEMSLVGPRPLPDYHLTRFAPDFRGLRRRVLPGLTGLWQISARGDGDLKVQEDLDTFYIRNWSPWLDLYILARTVTAVLFARGAY